MRNENGLTYLHSDHLGSTVIATDSAGNEIGRSGYRAYGGDRNGSELATEHRYTGQNGDGTGLAYYNARYYDPTLGTFISPDSMVADPGNVLSYNRLMYTLGNPLKYNDPSGHICVPVINYGSTCNDPTLVDTGIQLVASVAAGDVGDYVTLVSGYDYISGEEVPYFSGEWWATGAMAVLPFASGATVKSAVKTIDKVDSALGTGVVNKIDEAITGVKCFFNSFSAETLVMTARGLCPISELVEGDLVLAWDEESGKTGYFVVTDTISHIDPSIVLLTLEDETLETTADHPFYVVEENAWFPLEAEGRWVEAGELRVGDAILQADGETGRVLGVQVVAQPQVMYNLTMDVAHTFFVGQGQWLVHNCKGAKGLVGKDFENWLTNSLGGQGAFKVSGREFDGAIGNVWYEAKSGEYWGALQAGSSALQKFQSDMGARLGIAIQNGASYVLHSNTPIPQHIKDWLTSKGIQFFEHLE